MELAHWMGTQVAKDLKTSINRSDASLHGEVAKCATLLSNLFLRNQGGKFRGVAFGEFGSS